MKKATRIGDNPSGHIHYNVKGVLRIGSIDPNEDDEYRRVDDTFAITFTGNFLKRLSQFMDDFTGNNATFELTSIRKVKGPIYLD